MKRCYGVHTFSKQFSINLHTLQATMFIYYTAAKLIILQISHCRFISLKI